MGHVMSLNSMWGHTRPCEITHPLSITWPLCGWSNPGTPSLFAGGCMWKPLWGELHPAWTVTSLTSNDGDVHVVIVVLGWGWWDGGMVILFLTYFLLNFLCQVLWTHASLPVIVLAHAHDLLYISRGMHWLLLVTTFNSLKLYLTPACPNGNWNYTAITLKILVADRRPKGSMGSMYMPPLCCMAWSGWSWRCTGIRR